MNTKIKSNKVFFQYKPLVSLIFIKKDTYLCCCQYRINSYVQKICIKIIQIKNKLHGVDLHNVVVCCVWPHAVLFTLCSIKCIFSYIYKPHIQTTLRIS